MSRSRTRTTDRVLETFGVAKKSVNAEFVDALEQHNRFKAQVMNVRHLLTQYYASVLATADMSWNMTTELREFFGKGSEGRGAMREFSRVHELMDKRIPVKMQGAFQQVIIGPLDAWWKQLDDVKELEEAYENARLQYDHYKRKVKSLEDQRIARVNKQKPVKPKDMDRLMRNREKLQEAEKKYDEASKQAVATMTAHWESRTDRMDALLMRIMQFQSQFFKEMSSMASHLDSMVEAMRRKLDPDSPEWRVMVERFEPTYAEEKRLQELVDEQADRKARRRLQHLMTVMDADTVSAAAAAISAGVGAGASAGAGAGAGVGAGAEADATEAAAVAEVAAAMRPKRRSWAFWRKGTDGASSPTAQTSAPAAGGALGPSPTEHDAEADHRPGKPAPAGGAGSGGGAAADDANPEAGTMPSPLRPQVRPPPAVTGAEEESFPGDPSPYTTSPPAGGVPAAAGAPKPTAQPYDPFGAAAASASDADPADPFGSVRPSSPAPAPAPAPAQASARAFGSVPAHAAHPAQEAQQQAPHVHMAASADPFATMAASSGGGAGDDWFGSGAPSPPPRPPAPAPAHAPAPAPAASFNPFHVPSQAPAPAPAPAPALPRVSPVSSAAADLSRARLSAPAPFSSPPGHLAPPSHRSARVTGGGGGGLSSALRTGGAQAPAHGRSPAAASTNPFESLMHSGAPAAPAAPTPAAAAAPPAAGSGFSGQDPFAGFGAFPAATQPNAPAPAPAPARHDDPFGGFDSLL